VRKILLQTILAYKSLKEVRTVYLRGEGEQLYYSLRKGECGVPRRKNGKSTKKNCELLPKRGASPSLIFDRPGSRQTPRRGVTLSSARPERKKFTARRVTVD